VLVRGEGGAAASAYYAGFIPDKELRAVYKSVLPRHTPDNDLATEAASDEVPENVTGRMTDADVSASVQGPATSRGGNDRIDLCVCVTLNRPTCACRFRVCFGGWWWGRKKRRPLTDARQRAALILQADVAAKTDGKSYFYQFGLPRRIRRFFKCRLAGRRGGFRDVQLARLPMGWSWSPAIAQWTSNFLVRGCGLAWLDDFIICGTRADFAHKRNAFQERLQKYNVEVDNTELEGSDHLLALGLEFDLSAKRYRVDPAWIERRRERWLETLKEHRSGRSTTIRQLLEVYGSLIWTSYVLEEPLWMHAEALAALSQVAKQAAHGGFDDHVVVPQYALDDLSRWVDDACTSKWCSPRNRPLEFDEFVFSDASDTACAFIHVVGKDIIDGDAWLRLEKEHIFLGELDAACAAAPRASDDALYAVDNKTLHYVFARGHSSSFVANVRLRAAFPHRRPWSSWIPTHIEPGDKYTRGTSLPSFPRPTSSDNDIGAALTFLGQHDANGVPISKRKSGTSVGAHVDQVES
jgi:hypothetical protein